MLITDEAGTERILWLFSLVLGHSRMLWAHFVLHQDLPTLLRCHAAAFEALGGVPEHILYDRMRTVFSREDPEAGHIVYNRTLLEFARHYGYLPKACKPYRAKTKGKVERPYRYIREDFFLGRSFRNLDDLNQQLRQWLDQVANVRVHATTRRVVAEHFAEERPKLQQLPAGSFQAVLRLERRITRDGMVSVDGNLYSVPNSACHAAAWNETAIPSQINGIDVAAKLRKCLCLPKISSGLAQARRCGSFARMIDLFKQLGGCLVGLFRSHADREAEIMFFRHQLLVLRRSAPPRLRLRTADRLIFVWLYRLFPSLLGAAIIFKPETLVRWHRSGIRLYWRWKSRRRVGRPAVPTAIRDLVRTISRDYPLWGAPRIHGELLKLGIDIAQSTVAKYMCRRRRPPSTGWRAFLRIHTAHIAAVDLFVIPTIGFKLLYGLVILRLERRRLVWINVTAHPTAEWIARQITEAFPWDEAPRYLIRDRDTAYGVAVTRRLRAMGIRDRPISPRSPWQNGHVERLIGSIRRECLDHVVALGEEHVRHLLINYQAYYNGVRTLRSTRMLRCADHRRQSVGLHQSHGSTASIVSTPGWRNW